MLFLKVRIDAKCVSKNDRIQFILKSVKKLVTSNCHKEKPYQKR